MRHVEGHANSWPASSTRLRKLQQIACRSFPGLVASWRRQLQDTQDAVDALAPQDHTWSKAECSLCSAPVPSLLSRGSRLRITRAQGPIWVGLISDELLVTVAHNTARLHAQQTPTSRLPAAPPESQDCRRIPTDDSTRPGGGTRRGGVKHGTETAQQSGPAATHPSRLATASSAESLFTNSTSA